MDELIEAEKLYQVFVTKKTGEPVNNSLVIANNEIEAIKKAGITFDAGTQRIFIGLVGNEYRSEIVVANLVKYKDTIKSISCYEVVKTIK
jgi:hypothetical protein